MGSQRVKKVESFIRREISEILINELRDPRLIGVTVMSVECAPDIKRAVIYYRIMERGVQARKEADEALGKARGAMRRILGDRIQMKFTPELHFKYDPTEDKAQVIENILDSIKKEHNDAE